VCVARAAPEEERLSREDLMLNAGIPKEIPEPTGMAGAGVRLRRH